MKRFLVSSIACLVLFPMNSLLQPITSETGIVCAQPPYAKWGNLAIEKTKERYPKAQIVDYLHIGRENKPNNIAVEKFKLWLKEGQREYGVLVSIEFDVATERVMKVTFSETSR